MSDNSSNGRISFWHIGLAVLGFLLAGIGFWQIRDVNRQLENRQNQYMVSILNERRDALTNWLGQIRDDVEILATMPAMVSLLKDIDKSLQVYGHDRTAAYLRLFAGLEDGQSGDKVLAEAALDASGYSELHDQYQTWFSRVDDTLGFYDAFLFNLDGLLVYSVEKEDDFGTNLLAGPWANTGLGTVVREVLEHEDERFVSFADYAFYGPSAGDAASFMATGIRDNDGALIGVFAVQMPKDRLNAILNKRPGEQHAGRFYLSGDDGFLRSDVNGEDTLLRRRGISSFSNPDLSEDAVTIMPPRRGVTGEEVIAAARVFRVENVEFTIVAEFDRAVIHDWHDQQRLGVWLLIVATTLIALLILQLLWALKKPDQPLD